MKAPVLLLTLFELLLVELVLVGIASPGQRGFPTPPPPMNTDSQTTTAQSPTLRRQVDFTQLQKEADDLARTAQTIPGEMASVRKGTLPKDLIEKLKRIEKLSKQMRSQVTP